MTSNFTKLVTKKIAIDAIPTGGGFADGLEFLSSPEKLAAAARIACQWAAEAIRDVREATDPNPFRNASDDDIAAEILRQIEQALIAKRLLELDEDCQKTRDIAIKRFFPSK